MAFIQSCLTGTSAYMTLTNRSVFVQAFRKQFSPQMNAYNAQVEALTLAKKGQ